MINIRKTRKECTGPVWGGCAKNVMKVIKNKTIYTGNGVIEDGFVRYEKTIAEVGSMQNFVSREEDEIVEVEGMYLIPGFIDVHSHGGYGLDSMDASADEIDWMVRQMAAKEGITSYFCTTMTQTSENIESAMKNIKAAAEKAGVEYLRLLRPASPLPENCLVFESAKQAAEALAAEEGNLLLATGAKELAQFAVIPPERLYPRVLPTLESIAACEAANIPHRNIIAMQGPFSFALNQAMMELGATVCLPNGAPLCQQCPAEAFCQARKQGRTKDLPVRPAPPLPPGRSWWSSAARPSRARRLPRC